MSFGLMGAFAIPITVIVLGLAPSFTWLVFYLHEHFRHPEPKRLIFATFLAGVGSTFAVLPVQVFLNRRLLELGVGSYTFPAFVVLAATEELFKFLAVYFFIHKNRAFREPLDAMIYMITGALGFAAVENIALLQQSYGGAAILDLSILEQVSLRFIGATLLHSLASGLVGYYWGLAFLQPQRARWHLAEGLLIASVLHAVFNYLIIKNGPAGLAIIFLIFVGFFVLNDFEKFKKVDT